MSSDKPSSIIIPSHSEDGCDNPCDVHAIRTCNVQECRELVRAGMSRTHRHAPPRTCPISPESTVINYRSNPPTAALGASRPLVSRACLSYRTRYLIQAGVEYRNLPYLRVISMKSRGRLPLTNIDCDCSTGNWYGSIDHAVSTVVDEYGTWHDANLFVARSQLITLQTFVIPRDFEVQCVPNRECRRAPIGACAAHFISKM